MMVNNAWNIAAKNAMAIRRAVKQYGKTQSLVALVGQEGLAVAQSFSMEGFWEKVKNVLLAIWMKIKEWWNRFWGLFFSMDKRLAIFLLDEASKTGSDQIKLTHEQIARYMGSAREVVSRMLKYFATEGLLRASRSDGIILLDKARLRALTVN
jgi:hypothetical protein